MAAPFRRRTTFFLLLLLPFFYLLLPPYVGVQGLGSMSSAAAAYGSNGPALCRLLRVPPDGDGAGSASGVAACFGSDAACVYGAPLRLPLSGLTAGDGFVCGLTASSSLPYCWGNNVYVQQGVPAAMAPNLTYAEISAGDNHLCALRSLAAGGADCWGYNLTGHFLQAQPLRSITSGALFSCALLASNATPVCWGDDTGSGVIRNAPRNVSFRSISAGGYHVCGILESDDDGATLCWGRKLQDFPADARFSALVGGKFHACGLLRTLRTLSCWGFVRPPNGTMPPSGTSFSSIVAGDYYTCGTPSSSDTSQPPPPPPPPLPTLCWGSQFPADLPTAAAAPTAGTCTPPCRRNKQSIQISILVAELAVAVFVVACTLAAAVFAIKYKLSFTPKGKERAITKAKLTASCNGGSRSSSRKGSFASSFRRERVRPEAVMEDPKMFQAEVFSLQELEQATAGFSEEYEVGKGRWSCVYRGVLSDGRMVAVKRINRGIILAKSQDTTEFRNEVDLLSRLNHAHLLKLLGFCDEREERILVYEYMANGTLQEQLHGGGGALGWERRVTIAVQAARGLEYLHGYACPPVIHMDVKSSNILLDDDWNARVSDLGGGGGVPATDPPPFSAAASGYVDPDYYTHHYFTTKSDVYSFGVLLLEILSGQQAEVEIVEWALSLIKAGQVPALLDPRPDPPGNLEAIGRVARIAAKCVKVRGKDRPSMDKVTTSLERALATMIIGSFSNDAQPPLLPSEVVLGSNRLHRKSSQKSSSSCGRGGGAVVGGRHSSAEAMTMAIAIPTEEEEEEQQQQQQRHRRDS